MKKISIFIFILSMLFLLAGCSGKKSDSGDCQVYYANAEKTVLIAENYSAKGTTTEENIMDLWMKMTEKPVSSDIVSLVPEELNLQGIDLTNGQLTVTFDNSYYNMDNISEILLRAGLVEGFTQFADVKKVVFHIGEDVLRDHSGEPVGAMTRSDFINNPVGINSYQYTSLTLYYSNFLGDALVKEMRNVHYSSNTTLEKVVMEQLLKGPMNKQLNPVLSDNIKVLGINVENKTCTVNLNSAFLEKNKLDIKPEVVIYAIVNSLCDVLEVDKVQFQVEGSSDVVYADELSLVGPFHRKSDLIESMEEMTNLESEMNEKDLAQPSIGL